MRSEDQLVADLLYGRANTMAGSGLDDQSLIQIAGEEFSGRAYAVVRDWMILDVILPSEELNELTAAGQQPMILLAPRVVHDSDMASPRADLLITGFCQDFFGCFFEVDSKVYVLAGRGARKYAAMPSITALKRVQISVHAEQSAELCFITARDIYPQEQQ